MCDTCGCSEVRRVVKEVGRKLTDANERIAQENREIFNRDGVTVINLISSPGAGKTTLLERTVEALAGEYTIGVLEGDIDTTLDAQRIREKGVHTVQLTTSGACHLDAPLVKKGYEALVEEMGSPPQLLFIENVGNLVCPASFHLGEHHRVVLVSVPEGTDKAIKYPKAFKTSQIFLITKVDLLSHFDFNLQKITNDALAINPQLTVIPLSSKNGEGVDRWLETVKTFLMTSQTP